MINQETTGNQMTYGIEDLDNVLSEYLNPGHLHLFEGFTGSGKTAVACQVMVENTSLGKNVLYISTEETGDDCLLRCISNGVGIQYDESMQLLLKNVQGKQVPFVLDSKCYTHDECVQSAKVCLDLEARSEFCQIDASRDEDVAITVRNTIRSTKLEPDLVILDYLRVPYSSHTREKMIQVMQGLRDLSRSMKISIVVFAQLNPAFQHRAKVPVTATSECKTLHELADVSMAMSWLTVPELPDASDAGYSPHDSYLREQYLNVQAKGINVVLPVKTHYDRMALEWGDHEVDERNRDHVTVDRDRNKALDVMDAGGMRNYFWVGRSVYERLLKIGYAPAVNVYVFHMLVANKKGISNHSYEGMADKMSLSVEQIRTAIEKLSNTNMLKKIGKKKGMKRQVVKLPENNAYGDDKGSVKLNQNIYSSPLLRDQYVFRLWLYLLMNAESNFDSDNLPAGDIVVVPDKVAEKLKGKRNDGKGMSPYDIRNVLQVFERDDRIKVVMGSVRDHSVVLRLINWNTYQFEIPRALSEGYGRKK